MTMNNYSTFLFRIPAAAKDRLEIKTSLQRQKLHIFNDSPLQENELVKFSSNRLPPRAVLETN